MAEDGSSANTAVTVDVDPKVATSNTSKLVRLVFDDSNDEHKKCLEAYENRKDLGKLWVDKLLRAFFQPSHLEEFCIGAPHGSQAQIHGVFLAGKADPKKKLWYCLHERCNTANAHGPVCYNTSSSTSRAIKHINDFHQSKEVKQQKAEKKVAAAARTRATETTLFRNDPARYHIMKYILFMVDKLTPISFCETDSFRDMMETQPQYPAIYVKRVKHHLMELYLCLTDEVRKKLKVALDFYGNTNFHFVTIDLWDAEVDPTKYLGVRIHWINPQGSLESHSVAITPYSPSTAQMEDAAASKLVAEWTLEVLEDFGLSKGNIVGSSYDRGADISRASRVELCTPGLDLTEWCLCHLMNRVLVDAFGMSEDRRRSKNREAREVCDQLTRSVEALRKSKPNMQRLAELQEELRIATESKSKRHAKVVNYAAHRWGSIDRLFCVLLANWSLIRVVFQKSSNVEEWDLDERKEEVEHMYYVLAQTKRFMVGAQGVDTLHTVANFMQLFHDMSSPYVPVVKVQKPTVTNSLGQKRKEPAVPQVLRTVVESELSETQQREEESAVKEKRFEVLPTALDPIAAGVKEKVVEGMMSRFFSRYSAFAAFESDKRCFKKLSKRDELTEARVATKIAGWVKLMKKRSIVDLKASYGFDVVMFLNPATKDSHIRSIFRRVTALLNVAGWRKKEIEAVQREFREWLRELIWEKIAVLARKVSAATTEPTEPTEPTERASPASATGGLSGLGPAFNFLCADQDSRLSAPETPPDPVATELGKYRSFKLEKQTVRRLSSTQGVLRWWSENAATYPILHKVAFICLGLPATSAAQERDFCAAKELLRPKRSTLGKWLVEVLLFLKHNQRLIPKDLARVPSIDMKEAMERVPKRMEKALLYVRQSKPKTLLPADLCSSDNEFVEETEVPSDDDRSV